MSIHNYVQHLQTDVFAQYGDYSICTFLYAKQVLRKLNYTMLNKINGNFVKAGHLSGIGTQVY